MQYSKYNNPTQVVRDETSTAQAICTENLKPSNYFTMPHVVLYFFATTLLPIITTLLIIVIVWMHRRKINKLIANSTYQVELTSISLTGALITAYIFLMDISSIMYVLTNNHEYKHITDHTKIVSLYWTFVTLFIEIVSSMTAVLLSCIILTRSHGLLYIKFKIDRFIKLLIIVLPVIFVSAHINYILAAWITEPSKTTSVATLALALILLLYVLNKFLYRFATTITENRISTFCITVSGALIGVFVISVEVAAFYILPLPAVNLADYLENTLMVSVFLVTALITYKIFDKDSDASILLKKFNQHFKQYANLSEDSDELITYVLEAIITPSELECETATNLLEPTLKLRCSDIEYLIPVSKVELYKQQTQNTSCVNLANGIVEVALYDSNQNFLVCLSDGHLKIDHEAYELSKNKIKLIKGKNASLQAILIPSRVPALKEIDIGDKTMTINATSTCYLSEVKYDGTCCYEFDRIMTIKRRGGPDRNILLPDNPKMNIIHENNEHHFQIAGIKSSPGESFSNSLSIKIGKRNQFKLNTNNSEITLKKANDGTFFTIVCQHVGRNTDRDGGSPNDEQEEQIPAVPDDIRIQGDEPTTPPSVKLFFCKKKGQNQSLKVNGRMEKIDFENYILFQATSSEKVVLLKPQQREQVQVIHKANLPATITL